MSFFRVFRVFRGGHVFLSPKMSGAEALGHKFGSCLFLNTSIPEHFKVPRRHWAGYMRRCFCLSLRHISPLRWKTQFQIHRCLTLYTQYISSSNDTSPPCTGTHYTDSLYYSIAALKPAHPAPRQRPNLERTFRCVRDRIRPTGVHWSR